MINLVCKYCDKNFKVHNYRKNSAKYCSKKCSDIGRIGLYSPWNKGKKNVYSNETLEIMSIKKRGKPVIHSEETRRKIGNSHRGKPSWWKGRKRSKENIEKFSGSNHWNWQGGNKVYPLGWTNTYKEQIRYRDRYTCQVCGMPEVENMRKLSVHHIDYNKMNISQENLISLCIYCHTKTNRKKEYWKEYFNSRRENDKKDSFGIMLNSV